MGQDARGRGVRRGLLLLAFLFAATISGIGQGAPKDISADTASRLARLISGGSKEEKRAALFEIRNLRSAAASAIAVPALADNDEIVRATAAGSVVFMSGPDAARVLIPLLNDKAEFVRREAAYGLGEAGESSGAAPLVRLMQNDPAFEVRTASAIALGKIGDRSALQSLVEVLRSRPNEDAEFLRRSAARSIGQIAQKDLTGDTSVVTPQNFLPEKFKELGPEHAAKNTAPSSSAVDVLVGVLKNNAESDDTRREAAFALGAIGDPRAVPTLQTSTRSSDRYLAEIAREALLKIARRSN